jgi:hypothetical protein
MTVIFDSPEDAVGGVGGVAGINRDGMQATLAMMEMIKTMLSTSPKAGLMSCASYISRQYHSYSILVKRRTHSTTKRVRQTRQRCSSHAPTFCEPHITIPRRRRKHKWLRKPSQDLTEHDEAEDLGRRAGIPDPVADQE